METPRFWIHNGMNAKMNRTKKQTNKKQTNKNNNKKTHLNLILNLDFIF